MWRTPLGSSALPVVCRNACQLSACVCKLSACVCGCVKSLSSRCRWLTTGAGVSLHYKGLALPEFVEAKSKRGREQENTPIENFDWELKLCILNLGVSDKRCVFLVSCNKPKSRVVTLATTMLGIQSVSCVCLGIHSVSCVCLGIHSVSCVCLGIHSVSCVCLGIQSVSCVCFQIKSSWWSRMELWQT